MTARWCLHSAWLRQIWEILTLEQIQGATKYDPWFLEQIENIISAETNLRANGMPVAAHEVANLKCMGFSDARLAELTGIGESNLADIRHNLGIDH